MALAKKQAAELEK